MTGSRAIVALAVVAAVGAGTAIALFSKPEVDSASIDVLQPTGPGPLDGLVFKGMLGPEGKPLDVADTFVFADGTFVSVECELRCDYPARPYVATETADGWQFTSITRCPYKDATIVWNGTVKDNRISGVATWTMNRWYWSIERDFEFEATLSDEPKLAANTN